MMKGLRASLWVWLAAVVTGASSFTLVSQVPARPLAGAMMSTTKRPSTAASKDILERRRCNCNAPSQIF
jgi:hypothetical protein